VVLETDEAWLGWAVDQTSADTAVLLNLSRDQLHRHHEVAALARRWRAALAGLDHAVANADDPDVVFAAGAARTQTWVAVGSSWTQDALVCPDCGGECRHDEAGWWCACGRRRPDPLWRLAGHELIGPGERVTLRPALPGHANLANAAMAVATAATLGVDPQRAADAVAAIAEVQGRYAVVEHEGRRARLILAKNPAGWTEALDMVTAVDAPLVLAFNADGVDGRDPSWLYDVRFDRLLGRPVVVVGRRATDMVVRLGMDGLLDVRTAPDARTALRLLPPGPVSVIANYTAFREVRKELSRAT
jgi:UDP-N-acetylmuramyl tripeptide synthase